MINTYLCPVALSEFYREPSVVEATMENFESTLTAVASSLGRASSTASTRPQKIGKQQRTVATPCATEIEDERRAKGAREKKMLKTLKKGRPDALNR